MLKKVAVAPMPMMPQPSYGSPLVRRLIGRAGKRPQALYAVPGEKHAKSKGIG